MKPTITGFLDFNQTSSFEDRIQLASKHQLDYICLRSYDSKPMIEVSEKDIKDILVQLKTTKMKIAAIDAGIKSYDIHHQQKHEKALEEFTYLVKVADKLKVTYLFYELPLFTDVIEEYQLIESRLTPFLDVALKNGKKIILSPNNNYKANTYAYLLKKLKTNILQVAFNPVLIMLNNESTTTSYRLLKGSIGAFIANDADHEQHPKLLGYGKTEVIVLFKKLIRDGYSGLIMIDNSLHEALFQVSVKKQGFFSKLFSNEDKKKKKEMDELSKKIFPNEETKNVTYDDILENQIKVLNIIFK
jgi:sugar phosphate isomerase/epimerase